jgi:hypothetical protein
MRVNTFAKIAATGIAALVLSMEPVTSQNITSNVNPLSAQSTSIQSAIPFFNQNIYQAEHNGAKVMFVSFSYFVQDKKGMNGVESDYIVSREVINARGKEILPDMQIVDYNADADGILTGTENKGIRTVFITLEQLTGFKINLTDHKKVDITDKFMEKLPKYQGDVNKYNRVHTK